LHSGEITLAQTSPEFRAPKHPGVPRDQLVILLRFVADDVETELATR
jgi:hypothetical protein